MRKSPASISEIGRRAGSQGGRPTPGEEPRESARVGRTPQAPARRSPRLASAMTATGTNIRGMELSFPGSPSQGPAADAPSEDESDPDTSGDEEPSERGDSSSEGSSGNPRQRHRVRRRMQPSSAGIDIEDEAEQEQDDPVVRTEEEELEEGEEEVTVAGEGASRPRKRRRREEGAPIRPKSAFMCFLTDYRQQHSAQLAKMRVADVARLAGQAWKDLSPEERDAYDRMSTESKARYAVEREAFEESQGRVKVERAPGQPSRPKGAFLYFLEKFKDRRKEEEAPKVAAKVLSQMASEEWKKMSSEERQPFIDQSQAGKAEYQAWKKAHAPAVEQPPARPQPQHRLKSEEIVARGQDLLRSERERLPLLGQPPLWQALAGVPRPVALPAPPLPVPTPGLPPIPALDTRYYALGHVPAQPPVASGVPIDITAGTSITPEAEGVLIAAPARYGYGAPLPAEILAFQLPTLAPLSAPYAVESISTPAVQAAPPLQGWPLGAAAAAPPSVTPATLGIIRAPSPTATGRLLPAPPLHVDLQQQESFSARIRAQIEAQLTALQQIIALPTPPQISSLQPLAPGTATSPPQAAVAGTTPPPQPVDTGQQPREPVTKFPGFRLLIPTLVAPPPDAPASGPTPLEMAQMELERAHQQLILLGAPAAGVIASPQMNLDRMMAHLAGSIATPGQQLPPGMSLVAGQGLTSGVIPSFLAAAPLWPPTALRPPQPCAPHPALPESLYLGIPLELGEVPPGQPSAGIAGLPAVPVPPMGVQPPYLDYQQHQIALLQLMREHLERGGVGFPEVGAAGPAGVGDVPPGGEQEPRPEVSGSSRTESRPEVTAGAEILRLGNISGSRSGMT